MQLSFLMMTIMSLAIMAPFIKSLISLGGLLLLTAMLMTMLVSQLVISWFGFILFLVYITGLLVLFSYMMAMSPNSYFTQKKTIKPLLPSMLLMILSIMTWLNPTITLNPMKGVKSFGMEVSSIFMGHNLPMYWLIAIVLLIALLMAVTICYKVAKPLRAYLS